MSTPVRLAPGLPSETIPIPRFVDSTFPGNYPADMRTPPLKLKNLLEPNPVKSRISVRRLAVSIQ